VGEYINVSYGKRCEDVKLIELPQNNFQCPTICKLR
jgi:hypothetical protein